jgi:Fic family protein
MRDKWRIIWWMAARRYPALHLSKIASEVVHTDALIRHLMSIAESKPFLDEYLGTPQEVKFLRRAKVRAITSSNQIEGNQLDENEVTAILQGKRVTGSPKDILETHNYHAALEYAEKLAEDSRPLRLSDMCDIHRLVTQGLVPEAQCGRVRTIPVSIINAVTGQKLEDCPEPHLLKDLLDDLWRWVADASDLNPFVRACAFHFIAVSIHPFADGNGKTMRLMQHLLLLRGGERVARFVPSEFLVESFAIAAREVVEEGRRLRRESAGRTPDARYRKILSHARKTETFSMQDVVAWMPDVPRRTLERDLAALVRKRAIKAKGKNKARTYRVT